MKKEELVNLSMPNKNWNRLLRRIKRDYKKEGYNQAIADKGLVRIEEVEKIIDESIPKKLIELEKMRATVEGHHPNLSKSEMIKNELKSKIKELNK